MHDNKCSRTTCITESSTFRLRGQNRPCYASHQVKRNICVRLVSMLWLGLLPRAQMPSASCWLLVLCLPDTLIEGGLHRWPQMVTTTITELCVTRSVLEMSFGTELRPPTHSTISSGSFGEMPSRTKVALGYANVFQKCTIETNLIKS